MTPAAQPVAHIVDTDATAQQMLTTWLPAAGIASRTYPDLGAFLAVRHDGRPGCLVIDSRLLPEREIERQWLMTWQAVPYPIIVTSAQPSVALAVRAMKMGALDFVEKPMSEQVVVPTIRAVIELDRSKGQVASRRVNAQLRFETLTRREQEVMAWVVTGKRNKQIGWELQLSEITIKAHRGSVMRKMAARSLADLVRMADAIGVGQATERPPSLIPFRLAAGPESYQRTALRLL